MVAGTGPELWVPAVPLDLARNAPPPRLVDEPGYRDVRAGLDAGGRAVLVHDSLSLDALLTWDGPRLEIVGLWKTDDVEQVTWVDHDETGRPVRFSTLTMHHDRRGTTTEIATAEWEGDRCVRVRRQESDDGTHWRDDEYEADYDERGLVQVRRRGSVYWDREIDGYEEHPLAPDEALAAWGEAVAAAAARPSNAPPCPTWP